MSFKAKKSSTKKEVALILIEGETEVEFYSIIFPKYLGRLPRIVYPLHGITNIHNRVLDKTTHVISLKSGVSFRIFICIDRESRYYAPPLDITYLKNIFAEDRRFRNNILSVDKIIATPMIESWFFHDMDGLYSFLAVPRKYRRPNRYTPVEKFDCDDLSRLFNRFGKNYTKGKKCRNFIRHLNIDKIYKHCKELRDGISTIKKRFEV